MMVLCNLHIIWNRPSVRSHYFPAKNNFRAKTNLHVTRLGKLKELSQWTTWVHSQKKYTLDKFPPLVELAERTIYRLYFFSRRVLRTDFDGTQRIAITECVVVDFTLEWKNLRFEGRSLFKTSICFTFLLQSVLFKNYANKIGIYYFDRLVNRLYIRPTQRLLPRWSVCAINVDSFRLWRNYIHSIWKNWLIG